MPNANLRSLFMLCCCFLFTGGSFAQIPQKGSTLPAWKEGYLDLHHINTGRGNAAFFIFPDGTTMLFDAGEQDPTDSRTLSARNSVIRPNDKKHPYEWIVAYIKQMAPATNSHTIDYAVISHFHDDHMGAYYSGMPKSSRAGYFLTGITGVADLMPVKQLLDRGYPDYSYPVNMKSKSYEQKANSTASGQRYWLTMQNYFSFIEANIKTGMSVGKIKPGSKTQIKLKNAADRYPDFFVQNVKCNGNIWTGKDSLTFQQFPAIDTANPRSFPTENALSQVITINYGPFRYYTGGDCPGNVGYGDAAWMDVETPVAKAIGAVDVATLDHHGNRDALNETMIRTFRPRVWIEQVWSSDHPGHEVLIRLTTPYLYPGPRDLFATNMLQPNKDVIGPLIDNSYKSLQGHILVRVLPGGQKYYVIILDDSQEKAVVKDVFGPYEASQKN